jgi:hypothetical protein
MIDDFAVEERMGSGPEYRIVLKWKDGHRQVFAYATTKLKADLVAMALSEATTIKTALNRGGPSFLTSASDKYCRIVGYYT